MRPLEARGAFFLSPTLGEKGGNAYFGTITKRPRIRGPLFFLLFARQADSAGPFARSTSLRFRLLFGLLFHDVLLAVGPLSQLKQWQPGDERGVNRLWRRGTNTEDTPCVHLSIGAKDRGEYRQAAGAFAEAVIRSVELIVQPDAKDGVGEMGVRGDPSPGRVGVR